MNFKKVLSIASVASLAVVGLASCGKGNKGPSHLSNLDPSTYTGDIVGSVTYKAIGYMTYGRGASDKYISTSYTTVDGRTLVAGSTITPFWQDIATNNNITFKDGAISATTTQESMKSAITAKYVGNESRNIQLLQITTGTDFNSAVNAGDFVNIKDYVDDGFMPNLKNWLDDHEVLEQQLLLNKGNDNEGYYYTPYFDGLDQVECGFNMNSDIVRALLDDDPTHADYTSHDGELGNNVAAYVNGEYDTNANIISTLKYTKPYIASIDQEVAVAKADGTADKFTVKITEGNDIITKMNNLTTKNGQTYVETLKAYIDDVYGAQIGTGKIWEHRSDIFTGVNAVYNADELIALFRCVKANPGYLTGNASTVMIPFFPRTGEANRVISFLKLSSIWGTRGFASEQTGFWINADGKLVDGYAQEYNLYCLDLLRELQEEGLFPTTERWFQDGSSVTKDYRNTVLPQGAAFMCYDYNNVSAYNNDKNPSLNSNNNKCYNMVGVLPPLAKWQFNTTEGKLSSKGTKIVGASSDNKYSYTRFTEDDRSLKDGGWSIVAKNVTDEEVLKKCLEIMDYLYTPEGSVLECFGYNDKATEAVKATGWVKGENGEYIQQDADGNYYVNLSNTFKDYQVTATQGTWHDFMTKYWGGCLGVGNIRSNYLESQLTGNRQILATQKYTNAMSAGAMFLAKTSGENFLKCVDTTTSLSDTEQASVTDNASPLVNFWNVTDVKSGSTKTNWSSQALTVVLSGWSTATPTTAAAVGAYFTNSNASRGKFYARNMGLRYDATDQYSFLNLGYTDYKD